MAGCQKLAVTIYETTRTLPEEEKYLLTGQIRRCALSVPANIAESSTRQSAKEYSRFINIAYGSAIELLNHILIGKELNYFDDIAVDQARQQVSLITNQLRALNKAVNSNTGKKT